MYNKKTWGGPVEPFILLKYLAQSDDKNDDLKSSMIIFEWRDKDLIGVPDKDGSRNVRPELSMACVPTS